MSAMVRLQEWAAERVANGGAPIKVRLVKGANLPMELVEAELHHWPVATCESKQASDTNYKRVMNYALRPEHIKNVNLGVAGHNLFDLAFAWLLANKRNCTNGLDFEMLVGMAPGQAEAVRRTVGELLLYVPVVHPKEFDVAIAYLIRRLEEGANSENFMSAVFELAKDEKLFQREKERFLASLEQLDDEIPQPNRVQSRLTEVPTSSHDSFEPTADSDPAVLDNQQWAQEIRTQLADTKLGQDLADQAWLHTEKQLEECITTAVNSSWSSLSAAERAELLHRAGDQLAKNRGDLMVVAGAECGKTLDQSDPEVSEAVDFAHYYAE
ncbi:MAG: 1-pyrroline-5-carboxylate dehydrogenase, partial [Actinomycetales bacterium]